MPLARRVPKRGFVNGAFKKDFAIINLEKIEAAFEAGAIVDEAALRAKGLVKGRHDDGVKILGDGEISKAIDHPRPEVQRVGRRQDHCRRRIGRRRLRAINSAISGQPDVQYSCRIRPHCLHLFSAEC